MGNSRGARRPGCLSARSDRPMRRFVPTTPDTAAQCPDAVSCRCNNRHTPSARDQDVPRRRSGSGPGTPHEPSEPTVQRTHYLNPSTTPGSPEASQFFEGTHPFHPWYGRRFEVFGVRSNWGQRRVFFFDDADPPRLRSVPLRWTSLLPPDPFLIIAAGRSPFRFEELLALVQLCEALHG